MTGTRFLGSGFGLGLSPVMPGTCGTVLGVGVAVACRGEPRAVPFAALGAALVSLALGRRAMVESGRGDPGWFVLDEVAGYLLALVALPLTWPVLLGAFVAFRVFDIWKPWPVSAAERAGGTWGILLDDLVAGVLAHAVVRGALWLL